MSIVRVGSTKKYSDNYDKIFGKKKRASSKVTGRKKKAAKKKTRK